MTVVDASAVLEVLLRTADAERIAERMFRDGERVHAPHLLDVEVAQVIRRWRLRGDVTERLAAEAFELLAALPIKRYAHQPLIARVWSLRQNLTAYDATYIALAEALDASLVTRDARLAAAPGHRAVVELV